MKKLALIFTVFSIIFAPFFTSAQFYQTTSKDSVISAFRKYKEVKNLQISVPTVIEVPFSGEFIERFQFAVLNETTGSFEPYYFKKETFVNEIPITAVAGIIMGGSAPLEALVDKNFKTYEEFIIPSSGPSEAVFLLKSEEPITSSSITLTLDDHVALPNTFRLFATTDRGIERVVVAPTKMTSNTIRFPKTTSDTWKVALTYSQPLRISEVYFDQENAQRVTDQTIRFLAQPFASYKIYFDPDKTVNVLVGESGNLASNTDVMKLPQISSQANPDYVIADSDKDGIPDISDNCVSVSNTDQLDENRNGRGDACDDFDRDGLINNIDNCPNIPNANQRDADSDGIGDVCDNEESRITERHAWIPWAGIGFAAIVLVVLFILATKGGKFGQPEEGEGRDQLPLNDNELDQGPK